MRYLQIFSIAILFTIVSCSTHKGSSKLDKTNQLAPVAFEIQTSSDSNIANNDRMIRDSDNSDQPNETRKFAKFLLGPGDELSINVWRNDDLNRSVKIDPIGNISFPLVGEVHASGMAVSQLRKHITEQLSKSIVNPQVDINVTSVSSRKIYIFGEVRAPGTFNFDAAITVWEAILKAGGFTDDANTKNIFLARNEDGTVKVTSMSLDMKRMFQKGRISENLYLKNGDILFAPEKRIASFERFMKRLGNIVSSIYTLERAIVIGPNVKDVIIGESDENSGSVIISD